MSKILITGASSGFGYLITRTLLKNGHEVAATMRAITGRNRAVADKLKDAGAVPLPLDVTDTASVNTGVALALEKLGDIDVVINNAGVGVLGWQETFTPEDFQKLFDVNVVGVQRVNRAILPHFRAKRNGLLMHVSSMLGRFVMPFYGPYIATKFALEALADNYRVELSGFGIESVLIEPGGYGTEFNANVMRPSDGGRKATYGTMAEMPDQNFQAYTEQIKGPDGPNPQWVADAVLEVINTPRGQRPFRTPVDRTGGGDAVKPFNEAAESLQRTLYQAMGISELLTLKTS